MFSRLVAAAAFMLAANAASAQSVSDTVIGYRFGDYFREPGVADDRHPMASTSTRASSTSAMPTLGNMARTSSTSTC